MDIISYPNYRSVPAEETYARIKPLLGKMSITRVANITGLDEIGIPVYIAVRPNSRSLALSQGKGISKLNAKVSAIMETIESYHGEHIEIETVTASINASIASGLPLCDYTHLPAFNDRPLDTETPMQWIAGKELLQDIEKLVPYETIHVDMRISQSIQSPYFIQSSNGLASGNTVRESTNHAICELIERDSYACWTLRTPEYRRATKVILSSINCDICNQLIEQFHNANTYVGIWDIGSDSGLPAFLVRVLPKDKPPLCNIPPASGLACHPDKNLALIRALTEAAQSRLTFIAGARDDIRLSHYRTFTTDSEYDRWHHSVHEEIASRHYQNIPNHKPASSEDIWKILRNALVTMGIKEIIAVDLTKDEFGISVVKVVIPGLEGSESYATMKHGERAKSLISSNSKDENYA